MQSKMKQVLRAFFKKAVKPKANSITIVFTSFPINSFHISRSAHIKSSVIQIPDIHFMVIFSKQSTSLDCIRYCSELSRPIFVSTKKYRLLTNLSLFYIIYFTILHNFYSIRSRSQTTLIECHIS